MSWDSYIQSLMATGCLQKAAIFGLDGTPWAKSDGFDLSCEEVKELLGDRSKFLQCGPKIGGLKCRVLRDLFDDDVDGRLDMKTASDDQGNTYGVCVCKTKQALLIVMGNQGASGGQVTTSVLKVADHLKQCNY
ncbi:profilin-1-like [Pholidichthys leucotaenia]